MVKSNDFIQDKFLLLAIVVTAVILRLASPFEIPYTHDELSALFRTHFSTFSELIEKGVMPDGHPAGIQVFLYYWTRLFGYSEIVVKLPFIVFGVLAVALTFRIASMWYNRTVGFVSAAFVSTLQYTVIYSQIARPYISGLFFSLTMVYFWTKVVTHPQKKFLVNGLMYLFASILCAYNHYFSLLFAIIVGITGIFIINKKFLIRYLLIGVAISIAFIPHFSIFIHHLKLGGVEGWLGKPQNDFLVEYIRYVFNFSSAVFTMTMGLMVYGILKGKKSDINLKFLLISFCWFLLPFLIGFFYSRYFSAVLQYSVLIFSFPFLLFFLFGHIPELQVKQKWVIVSLILFVNTLSLILERKHYIIFYSSPFENIVINHNICKKTYPDCISIIDSDKEISKFYIDKLKLDSNLIWFNRFISLQDFIHFLQAEDKSHLYFGCVSGSNPILVSIIQDYYPYIEWQKNYAGGTSYFFSKIGVSGYQLPVYSSNMSFEKGVAEWSVGDKNSWVDSISFNGSHSYLIDEKQVWSPTYTNKLSKIINSRNNFIDVSVYIMPIDYPENVFLVSSLESKGKNVDWRATPFELYTPNNAKRKEWVKIHHTIKLSDVYFKSNKIELKVYIWNKGGKRLIIDNFEIKTRKGNPIIYGLIQKI